MSNTTLDRSTRLARHPHRCESCGGTIATGDHYVDQRAAGDGRVWTWREHRLCALLADRCMRINYIEPDEWGPDAGREELADWWEHFVRLMGSGQVIHAA